MAHGGDGAVLGYDDEPVALASLFGALTPSHAPSLKGKPKIWMVQACRSGEVPVIAKTNHRATRTKAIPAAGAVGQLRARGSADGTNFENDIEADVQSECGTSAALNTFLSDEHDYLWCFATSPGSDALRGAMFSAFRAVAAEQGLACPWLDLLQRTNEHLASRTSSTGCALPSMEISSTCRGAAFSPGDLFSPV